MRMIAKAVLGMALCVSLIYAQEEIIHIVKNGLVRGERTTVNNKFIDVLLSIPYAKPPIGSLRFKPPQPMDHWTDIVNATQPSPACLQSSNLIGADDGPLHFAGNFSEDCLYLNVWKPSYVNDASDPKLPVMVWIYGGAFATGMKDVPAYNGQYLAAEYDMIVVSMNYRVGVLGFGFLDDNISGNLGLLDQLEALKWVQNNIEEFGGDPNRVTIFGESAGSWSVGLHLVSPLSQNYFKNAIMQSGVPINKIVPGGVFSRKKSAENMQVFAKAMKCPLTSNRDIYLCLMGATAEQLLAASGVVVASGVAFFPVVDNYFLTENTLDSVTRGAYKKTNVMTGVMNDEYSGLFAMAYFDLFDLKLYSTGKNLTYEDIDWILSFSTSFTDEVQRKALRSFYESRVSKPRDYVPQLLTDMASDLMFVCPATLFGSLASPRHPVYSYVLNYRSSKVNMPLWAGVPHGSELELMFGLPLNPDKNYTKDDKEVSRTMMTYWTNFAKSGNPNSPLPVTRNWPTFDSTNQTYMALDTDSNLGTKRGFRRHECAFINDILPRIQHDEGTNLHIPACGWPKTSRGGVVRQDVGAVAAAVLLLMTSFF